MELLRFKETHTNGVYMRVSSPPHVSLCMLFANDFACSDNIPKTTRNILHTQHAICKYYIRNVSSINCICSEIHWICHIHTTVPMSVVQAALSAVHGDDEQMMREKKKNIKETLSEGK